MAENGRHGSAGVGRVLGAAKEVEAEGIADAALFDQFEGLGDGRLKAGGVVDHEAFAGGLGGGDHAVALFDGFGHGLFDEDMAAGFEGFKGERAMGDGRGEDVDGIEAMGEDAGEVGGGMGDLELAGESLGAIESGVGDGDEFDVGGVAEGDEVAFGDIAGADEADAEFPGHGY